MGHLSWLLFSDWVVPQLTFSTPYWQSPPTPTGSITPQFHFVLLYSFKVTAFTKTSGSMSCLDRNTLVHTGQKRSAWWLRVHAEFSFALMLMNSNVLWCCPWGPGLGHRTYAHMHICTHLNWHRREQRSPRGTQKHQAYVRVLFFFP